MNSLIVYGLNYHSCPVAIRERFTIPESCLGHALNALKNLPHIIEAVVLSTCNRTEVYAVVSNVVAGFAELESFFLTTRQIADHQALKADFKLLRNDVALHLFRVASGLDSMVLGEGQIMSQVKAAHQAALKSGSAGPILDSLFKSALNCGKKVRTQTGLGRRAVSISSAAVELTRQLLGGLDNQSVLVIGAGRMGQICAKLLLSDNNSGFVYVANRNQNKTKALQEANIRHLNRLHIVEDFNERSGVAANCDAVIVATSAPGYVLCAAEIEASINEREEHKAKPLYITDMSVPRNVDPQVANTHGIALYNFDHLSNIVKHNLAQREELTKDAEIIVFAALKEFEHWQHSLLVAPVIAQLRGKVENIRLSYLRHRLGHSVVHRMQGQALPKHVKKSNNERDKANKQLDKVSRIIVNQILHKPTIKLKAVRDYQSLQQQVDALKSLFDLSEQNKQNSAKPEHSPKTFS